MKVSNILTYIRYIGSTIRALHQRIKEHLSSQDGSVRSHQQTCKAHFTTSILARETDQLTLRFTEAIMIGEKGATINSRAEREELNSLFY